MSKNIPIVSIVGRRNVGKSTLFNSLIKTRRAIVDDHPGLTRDIISYKVNTENNSFILSDTPGLDLPENDELSAPILENAYKHLENSSIIILLFENPNAHSFDFDLLKNIRKLNKPTIIAVNKMDQLNDLNNMHNFYELGVTDLLPISAKTRSNLDLLITKISDMLPLKPGKEEIADLKVALVGRPNAGKSTLLNNFIGYERSIVSDIPGTTRDSVNEYFNFNEKRVEVIDTAGIRKKSKITHNVEFFSLRRTTDAITQCDVVIHLIDATAGLTDTDKKISDQIMIAHKPVIFAINKWDALEEKDNKTFEKFKDKMIFSFYKADDFPIISISAKEKQRIHKLLTTAFDLKEKASRRISTSELNKTLELIEKSKRLPKFGQDIKIYYATQVDTIPPKFKFFVNNPDHFRKDTIRFFEKEIQKIMNLKGIPIVINIEGKKNTRTFKGRKKNIHKNRKK